MSKPALHVSSWTPITFSWEQERGSVKDKNWLLNAKEENEG